MLLRDEGFYKSHSSHWSRCLTYLEYSNDAKSPKTLKTMDFGETVVLQLSDGAMSTATKSNGYIHGLPLTALNSTPCPRWIPRITTPTNEVHFYIRDTASSCTATKTQLIRCQVSAVPEKKQLHTATLGFGAKFNFNGHYALVLFIPCIYCLYAITMYSFVTTNYC